MQEIFCSHDALRAASLAGPPTSVSFDSCHEMIFVGWSNGEISSYRPSLLNDNLINWSAFPAHRTQVLQTFGGAGCDYGVFSLSSETLKIHTSGGMQLFSKRAESSLFTCMAAYLPDRVLCGTKAGGLIDVDVNASPSAAAAAAAWTCCQSSATKLKAAQFNPRIVFAGLQDGSVAMVDTRTGKTSARGDFQATTGGRVSDLDVNSSSLMVCAGYSNKNALEPYVRVFDLRMNNRQLNPIHFAAPIGVQFLQDGSYSNVLASSSAGVLRVVDVSTSTNLQFANVSTNGGKVQAMSTSFTGLSFSVVDTDNFIHVWETCPQYRDVCADLFLEEEHPASAAASAYRHHQTSSLAAWHQLETCGAYSATNLQSVRSSTPVSTAPLLLSDTFSHKLLHQRAIKPSPKATLKIRPELVQRLATATRSGVSVLPNETGKPGLSLLFSTKQVQELVYVTADPRRGAGGRNGGSPAVAASAASTAAASSPAGAAAAQASSSSPSGSSTSTASAASPPSTSTTPPAATGGGRSSSLMPPKFTTSKPRISSGGELDYSYINSTPFAGIAPLDFDPAASRFTSAVLQMLYFMPEFRNACMVVDVCPLTEEASSSSTTARLAVELNYLFRMLDTARALPSKAKCCQARNLIVALRASPAAAALGLGMTGPSAADIESCFTLAQLLMAQVPLLDGGSLAAASFVTLLPEHVQKPSLQDALARAMMASSSSSSATYLVVNVVRIKPPPPPPPPHKVEEEGGDEPAAAAAFYSDRVTLSGGEYELAAVISLAAATATANAVAYIRIDEPYAQQAYPDECGRPVAPQSWLAFDDASVSASRRFDDDGGDGNQPLVLLYKLRRPTPALTAARPVPAEVFALPAAAQTTSSTTSKKDESSIPRALQIQVGAVVAMDCEFVALTNDVVEVHADGSKVVTSPRQLALARVSVVDSNFNILVDDLVLPTQPVVDHLTRFSGLVDGDLDLAVSTHPARLFPFAAVYAKLLRLGELGCIFVGHGLDSDFKVVNMVLPPQQIRDTVQLFWLRGKRKLGLRFLSSVLLQQSIQDRGSRGHDSVQDAAAALQLYFKYQELHTQGALQDTLARVYLEGPVRNWC